MTTIMKSEQLNDLAITLFFTILTIY